MSTDIASGDLGGEKPVSFWRRLIARTGGRSFNSRLAFLLTIAALVAGIATYFALTESPPFGQDPETVFLLLNIDLVILLLLGAVIARRLAALLIERRRGRAGSRLHIRLAARFSVVAIIPAIVVASFSALFFQFGIQAWFSDRVSTAINESLSVAEAYLAEHQQVLRSDALEMASEIENQAQVSPQTIADPNRFNLYLNLLADVRNIPEAMVVEGSGRVLARTRLAFTIQFVTLPDEVLNAARDNQVLLLPDEIDDRVRAVVRLDNLVDTFLVVGRFVEAQVIGHMEQTQGAVAEYQDLQERSADLQITFTLIYLIVALLLLMISVWIGLMFADSLVTPIGSLITAAERVRSGDLTARVEPSEARDELNSLGRAFNRMTSQLESQRHELVEANAQLDMRRRFTEAVLTGVSAGVLGLDADGSITLPNPSALRLLGQTDTELVGRPLGDAVPEMAELMRTIRRRPSRLVESQVKINRGAESRTLLVRIAAERSDGQVQGYVATFDDVTELLSAQRKAAWADVARRIAHEIKNPLTPIQLSAERLKRRYLKEIQSDQETFVECTDTIVRQVGDIGRMVDEFSSFARMPNPVMQREDMSKLVADALALQRNAYPNVQFDLDTGTGDAPILCDARQIQQVLTNILQNALDSIDGRKPSDDGNPLPAGHITLSIQKTDGEIATIIEDNGKGLPSDDRDRLTEPYVTTREKGTGLGLAIVKKIVEDHGGRLQLDDRDGDGARVTISLPRLSAAAAEQPVSGDRDQG
ncbi:MAG: PAS domain-containing sensor histidine kinase [Pseudomonadota bacterium]